MFVGLIIPFSYEDKRLAQHWTMHNWRIEANILNKWHKLICVEKLRNSIPREHLPQLNVFFITVNWINCAAKLYGWPLTFHKVVWQQIWGEVV